MDIIKKAEIIIIKIGSSLLVGKDGKINEDFLDGLSQDVVMLTSLGKKLAIVSSGAIALGCRYFGCKPDELHLEEKQAAAACGQIDLSGQWQKTLRKHKVTTAQILLTINDSENRRLYLNACNTIKVLLEKNIISIVNENDTVLTEEIRIGDNDKLAARLAQMISADLLILLSDVNGLYNKNPHLHKDAKLIDKVEIIDKKIISLGGRSIGAYGSGGMQTKVEAAEIATSAGCDVIIANGMESRPIEKILHGGLHSLFTADDTPLGARDRWIAGSIADKGSYIIDEGAVRAIMSGHSLLPIGVKKLEGNFTRGEGVLVKDTNGKILAKGLTAYSSEDAVRIIGKKTDEIEKILGYKGRKLLIHIDNMVRL